MDYIKCGVPQGSVLGPLLFLLYINDISESSNLLKYFLFADDTMFYSSKNAEENEKVLNTEIDKVSEWLSANKLSLNVRKSKLLTFTLMKRHNINLTINNVPLEEVSNTKYLGIVTDNKLTWRHHIEYIKTKSSKGIGLLSKIRHYIPKNTLIGLCYSFINSYVEYGLLNY